VAEVIFVPNVAAQQRAFRSWEGMVGQHLRKITVETRIGSMLEAPAPGRPPRNRTGINYSTGELALGGITASFGRRGNELESKVIAIPDHAIFVHKGTIPHVIKPRVAKTLRFHWKKVGAVVYSKGVMHPGTEANEFMLRALKKAVRT
jgi:hypothetical protein